MACYLQWTRLNGFIKTADGTLQRKQRTVIEMIRVDITKEFRNPTSWHTHSMLKVAMHMLLWILRLVQTTNLQTSFIGQYHEAQLGMVNIIMSFTNSYISIYACVYMHNKDLTASLRTEQNKEDLVDIVVVRILKIR